MKKILITRKLIKDSEDKASKTFDPIFNSNDELYSQSKVIEMSKGCDGVLTSLTDKMDKETIDKLPDTIKIISNFCKYYILIFFIISYICFKLSINNNNANIPNSPNI